jgi:hypothetical protein
LGTIQLTVLVPVRHLLEVVASYLISIRVSPIPLGEEFGNAGVLPLEPQLTIDH